MEIFRNKRSGESDACWLNLSQKFFQPIPETVATYVLDRCRLAGSLCAGIVLCPLKSMICCLRHQTKIA